MLRVLFHSPFFLSRLRRGVGAFVSCFYKEEGTQTYLLGEAFWDQRNQGNGLAGATGTAIVPEERGALSPHRGTGERRGIRRPCLGSLIALTFLWISAGH